jgi:hypothetical protein
MQGIISRLSSKARDHIQVAAVLLVLLMIFFWRVTLLGEAYVATDLYFKWPPWKSVRPPGFQPHNPFLSDRADGLYPAYTAAREMLRQGTLPLWDPHVTSGRPFAAILHRGLLYPLGILMWLLPLDSAFGVFRIAQYFLAGLFMYLFLRELGVGKGGALVGGIVFTYNGFHVVWWRASYPSTIAPMMFWLAERLIQRKNGAYTCLLGLAVTATVTGGFVTVAAYFLYALGIYYVIRVLQHFRDTRDWHTGLRQLVLFALAVALGFLLVAYGVYAELEYWSDNSYVSQRIERDRGLGRMDVLQIARFFVPHYYGDPLEKDVFGTFPEKTGYLGILPWLLAVVALGCCWRGRHVGYFAGLAAISYGMVFGAPFNRLIGRLPALNAGTATRMLSSGAFALAGLAALGFDFLVQWEKALPAPRRRQVALVVLSAAVMMVALLAATELHLIWNNYRWSSHTLIQVLQEGRTTHLQVCNALLFTLWLFGGLNLILARTKGWLSTRTFLGAAAVLLALDLFTFGINYNPTLDPELVMPTTPGIAFLQRQQQEEQPFRILGLHSTLWPNSAAVYGLHDIRAHGSNIDRYERWISRIDPRSGRGHGHGSVRLFREESAQLDSPLLDLLNVRYILIPPDEDMQEAQGAEDLILVYDGEDMDVYENLSYFPRAYTVCQFEVIEDKQAILDRLADGSLDPHIVVALEKSPAVPVETVNTGCAATSPQVTRYEADEFVVQAEMAAPGFLVVSEITYPGWRAYVDGEETRVYRANYLFRAVYLPAGTHEVRFAYIPTGFWIGVAVSLVTLAGIAAVLGRAVWRHLAERRTVGEAAS